MAENENDSTRQVNPAARKDAPGEKPPPKASGGRDEPVRPSQGAALDPRDHGGIAE